MGKRAALLCVVPVEGVGVPVDCTFQEPLVAGRLQGPFTSHSSIKFSG